MRAYSLDLRQRVLADSDDGMKTRAVAVKYRVSEAWVRRLKQRRAPLDWQGNLARIRAAVAEVPDRTLEELRKHLGVRVSIATLWQALTDLKLSWKKSRSARRSRTVRT